MSGTEAILAALAVAVLTMVFAASVVARVLLVREFLGATASLLEHSGVYPMPSGRIEGGPAALRVGGGALGFVEPQTPAGASAPLASAPVGATGGRPCDPAGRDELEGVHDCIDSLNNIADHLEKSGKFPPARVSIGQREPSRRLDPAGVA